MYLALVFEISYSSRKIQKSVAWIIAAHFLGQAVNLGIPWLMPHLDTGGEVEERLDLIQ